MQHCPGLVTVREKTLLQSTPAHCRYPCGCLPTTWPGDAAWCRAALGRGLAVVWLYERPGLAFPYPLRVAPHTVFTRGLVAFLCCNFEACNAVLLFQRSWFGWLGRLRRCRQRSALRCEPRRLSLRRRRRRPLLQQDERARSLTRALFDESLQCGAALSP